MPGTAISATIDGNLFGEDYRLDTTFIAMPPLAQAPHDSGPDYTFDYIPFPGTTVVAVKKKYYTGRVLTINLGYTPSTGDWVDAYKDKVAFDNEWANKLVTITWVDDKVYTNCIMLPTAPATTMSLNNKPVVISQYSFRVLKEPE